jgi:regulator of sirC expression with transglutaminase-like and TPR domain
LHQVIDRRTGIPITLSLIYLELARRIDFPMVGVGFPGHFLIRPDFEQVGIHVDPFNAGEILFEQDCQERLAQIYGEPVELRPEFFQVVTARQLLVRMLTNLKQIYVRQEQWQACLTVVEQILVVVPDANEQLRDRGVLHYQLQNWSAARQDLQAYLARSAPNSTSPADWQAVQNLLKRMEDRPST